MRCCCWWDGVTETHTSESRATPTGTCVVSLYVHIIPTLRPGSVPLCYTTRALAVDCSRLDIGIPVRG